MRSIRAPRTRIREKSAALAVISLAFLVVAACGGGSDDEPITSAPGGDTPACSALIGRVPKTVLGAASNTSNAGNTSNTSNTSNAASRSAPGTASWGDPAVVLRCGVSTPGPTTDRCSGVNGLDWVFTETKDAYQFVTYGRTPAVEVRVPATIDRTEAQNALVDLADAVRPIKARATCVGADDA